jgi:hypothetical protein
MKNEIVNSPSARPAGAAVPPPPKASSWSGASAYDHLSTAKSSTTLPTASSWPGATAYGHLPAAKSSTTPPTKDFQIFDPRAHVVFHYAGGVGPVMRAALEPWVRVGRL